MPDYEVVTPLSNGRKKPIAPGTIVTLPEKAGAKLCKLGALKLAPTSAKSPAPAPAPTPAPTPAPAPAAVAKPAAAPKRAPAPAKPKVAKKPIATKL